MQIHPVELVRVSIMLQIIDSVDLAVRDFRKPGSETHLRIRDHLAHDGDQRFGSVTRNQLADPLTRHVQRRDERAEI
jgi:hypothetical protein